MSFTFFGKRRREGAPAPPEPREGAQPPPDEVLAADEPAAATEALSGERDKPASPPVLEGDLAMPRWRRPSLLEARKADPNRLTPIAPLTFPEGSVTPADGLERRVIRYHFVELLDAPDELRSAAIGSLTSGDQVQLLERSGSYWRVLCPSGQRGWIHRMTIGAVVGDEQRPASSAAGAPGPRDADASDAPGQSSAADNGVDA